MAWQYDTIDFYVKNQWCGLVSFVDRRDLTVCEIFCVTKSVFWRFRRGKNSTPARSAGRRGKKGWGAPVCKGGRTLERTRYALVTRKCSASGSCVWMLRAARYVGGPHRPPPEGSSSFLLSVWIRDSADPAIRKNPVERRERRMRKRKGKDDRVHVILESAEFSNLLPAFEFHVVFPESRAMTSPLPSSTCQRALRYLRTHVIVHIFFACIISRLLQDWKRIKCPVRF